MRWTLLYSQSPVVCPWSSSEESSTVEEGSERSRRVVQAGDRSRRGLPWVARNLYNKLLLDLSMTQYAENGHCHWLVIPRISLYVTMSIMR